MATKKYLVKLTPHDKFFFGGEKSFGQKDKDNKNDNTKTNYLVKSNYFPQQTGVLGFVRHQLLLQCNDETVFKDNKIQHKTEASKLIGKKSFRKNEDFNFGEIISLSPMFLAKNNDYYFIGNKEFMYDEKEKKCKFLQIKLEPQIELEEFDPKYGLADFFINNKGAKIKYDTVFTEHTQVGIRKKYEGGTDDDAYYIQTFLKFKKDFSFAFIVELEENTLFDSQNIVVFGAEQQAFKMEVEEFNTDFDDLLPNYQESKNAAKIVLVSDAFVDTDITDKCAFAITETIDFKFLETDTEKDKNYYTKPTKSKKYTLYKKGSVFYGDTAKISKLLDKDNFKNIGYNHYKTVNKQ